MLDFFDRITNDGKPWLVLGKGPSSEKITTGQTTDWSGYRVFALNHAIKLWPSAEIFHCIDADVLNDPSIQSFAETAKYLVMPFYPHFNQRPDPNMSLETFIRQRPPLVRKNLKGRILWYNLNSAPRIVYEPRVSAGIRIIRADYFSAEAAFDLLARVGVKKIDTLGIDGGSERADAFRHLKFENPHGTYDKQFDNLSRICHDYGITWRKL